MVPNLYVLNKVCNELIITIVIQKYLLKYRYDYV